ncbi:hypothetical protein [Mycoavidus sp. SF9855]|uniref:hypothetical protein n=1 Tax=Mycoavidus sp. SF9855 TaxID=2968475 RepID=UPI00211C6D44|nr:hypothetical protein [Mycoavidus sp. SF9855]UUM21860.1 hypothetical protein NQD60_01745 [Mycoavidus sp. SF9855]
MKTLKFFLIIFFQLFIVACGGGGGEGEAQTQHSEITTPSYFEDITNRNNCAIDAVNKALGEIFITPEAYEKYMMLIYAAKNDKTPNNSKQSKAAKDRAFKSHYITEKQYQAFLKFYKSAQGKEAKLKELEKEFNESRLEDASRMNFHEYKEHHGILGELKEVMRVIGIVNEVYNLELPLALTEFDKNNPPNFKGYESLIVHQADHFFALSKKNGYKLDSESQVPEILSSTDLTDRLVEMTGNNESAVSFVGFTLEKIQQAKKAFNANPGAFNELFAAVLQDPS